LGPEVHFIEQEMTGLLAANGLSYLANEMPQVYQALQNMGISQPLSAIQKAISELIEKGPKALIEEKLTNYLRPLTDPIKAWRPTQNDVKTGLQTYPTAIHTRFNQLTTTDGFEGNAAQTLSQTNTTLFNDTNALDTLMGNAMAADDILLTTIELSIAGAAIELASDIAAIVIAAVLDALAAVQGFIDWVNDLFAAVVDAVVGVIAAGPLVAAGIAISAAIVIWIGVYEAMANGTTTTLQSSISIPISGANSHVIDKWRDDIISKLKSRFGSKLTAQQLTLALARATAIVKALECEGFTQSEIDSFMNMYGDIYYNSNRQWGTPARNSLWYSIALLVFATTGGQQISNLSFTKGVGSDTIISARRIIRALIDPEATDGNGDPIPGGSLAITGGPTNVKAYSVNLYGYGNNPATTIRQDQYDQLPPDQQAIYDKNPTGEVDIMTNKEPGLYNHFEVGGSNKGDDEDFQKQLERLLALPGGRSTAYCVLEPPPANAAPSAWSHFDKAVATAKTLLDPTHIIILTSPSDQCTTS
jgi:hypothetical protein